MTDTQTTSGSAPRSSRRALLQASAVGVAAAAAGPLRVFDAAAAEAPARRGIFGYGVASGDPTGDAVVIWTRVTPPRRRPSDPVATPGSGLGAPTTVRWEVALDDDFERVVARGVVRTSPESDHTVKVDVTGLTPYTRYWYRFRVAEQTSPVGRTQTAPDEAGRTHALRFALASCSNYTGGYFTTYRALGKRDDLDFVLHVGDYIYEYGNGADRYGPPELAGTRDSQPAGETLDLSDYRLRHALHKADPDLQLVHAQHPFITIFDDHEVANNTWQDGAENHTPGVEGDFMARRRAAYQAYLEWLPFRLPDQTVSHDGIRFFKRFSFGALADLSVLETRQNRSRQVDVTGFTTIGGGFIPTGAFSAVDGALAAPGRHLPEPKQLSWLEDGLAEPKGWHLVGNQVILAPIRFPGAVLGAPPNSVLLNSDQWDGYQADQAALLARAGDQPADAGDLVMLTGDIHSSWAIDLPATLPAPGTAVFAGTPYESVGVEFVCPSVTSDGFYEIVRSGQPTVPPEAVANQIDGLAQFVGGYNSWLKYLDGVGHGYVLVDVTPERVQADFFHTPRPTADRPDPRVDPTAEPTYAVSWQTLAGSRRLSGATDAIMQRSDEPHESGGHRGRTAYPRRVRHADFRPSRRTPDFPHGPVDLRSLKD